MKAAHARSDASPQTLRISTDTKAKIKTGEFSRGGKSRGLEPVKASDHDMQGDMQGTQKAFNKELSRRRIVIENINAKIKVP